MLLPSPRASLAQNTHLPALRDWQWHTEEAGKYLKKGDYAKAEERINLAIKEIRPYLPETRRLMARSYCELARVLYHQKRHAEAEPLAKWALSVREADNKSSPDAVFRCVYTLALIQSALKHHGEAEPLLKRALALQEKYLGPDHVNSVLILHQLAIVYVEQTKYADAEPLYRRAIAIHERKRPDENVDLAATVDQYVVLLRRMKRFEDADQWHARALTIRDTVATKTARAKADGLEKEFQGFK